MQLRENPGSKQWSSHLLACVPAWSYVLFFASGGRGCFFLRLQRVPVPRGARLGSSAMHIRQKAGGDKGETLPNRSCHTEAAVGDGPAAQRLPEPRSAPRCGSSVQPQGDFSRCGRRGGAGGGAADAERIIVGPLVTLSRCRFAYMRRGTCDSAARRPERVFERWRGAW